MMNVARRIPISSLALIAVAFVAPPSLFAEPPAKSDHAKEEKANKAKEERQEKNKPAAEARKLRAIQWRVAGIRDDDKEKGEAKVQLQILPMLKDGNAKDGNVRVLMFKSDEADSEKLKQLAKDGVIVVVIPEKAAGAARGTADRIAKVRVERHTDGHQDHQHHASRHTAEDHEHAHDNHAHDNQKGGAQTKKEIEMRVEVVEDQDGKQQQRRVIILSDGSGKDGQPRMQFIPKDGKVIQLLRILPEGKVEVETDDDAAGSEHKSDSIEDILRALSGRAVGEIQQKLKAQLERAEAQQHEARARAEAALKRAREQAGAARRRIETTRRTAAGSSSLEKRLDRIEEQLRDLRGLVRELVEEVEEQHSDGHRDHGDDDDDDDNDDD